MRKWAHVAGLLGLLAFVALLVRNNGQDILRINAQAGWRLLWLVPYRSVYFSLYALGWTVLLHTQARSPRVTFGYLLWVTSVREAIDRLLPVASVGGAFAGVRLMHWRGFDRILVSATIIAEVVLTLWASYLFAALGLLLGLSEAGYTPWLWLLCTLPVPLVSWLLLRHGRLFDRLHRALAHLVGLDRLSAPAQALDQAMQALMRRTGALALASGLQLTALLSGAFEVWLALRWFGHPVSLQQAVILEAATQSVRHLAFFVPAALGVQEAGLVAFGQLVGLSPELALALSIAKRMREIICGLPCLAGWQWQEAVHLRRPAPLRAHS